jgi:flagellar biosynthesis protein FlhF
LESFLKVLEIPFRKADTKKAFDIALEDFADKDFIFVDIAGRSVYEDLSWKEIYNIFKDIPEDNLTLLLTLSFNMSTEVALEIYSKLKEFKLNGLVLTKADETQKRGIIFNAIKEMDLPMYYFTNGQKVPHNLLLATPYNLAKLILE